MKDKLQVLEKLGFERIYKHRNGMVVYIPDDLDSNEWCLQDSNGMNLYNTSFDIIVDCIRSNVNADNNGKYL